VPTTSAAPTTSTPDTTGSAGAAPAPVSSTPLPSGEAGEAKSPPPSVPHVEVTAVEYSFTLSRTTVPAGKVIFDFVNHGQDEHNLNILPGEGPFAGRFANTPSEGMSEQAVMLKPGSYTLFCSLPEHEKKGMKATLVVE
jgi:plastocyanin